MTDEQLRDAADLDYYRSQALFMTSTSRGEVTEGRDLVLVNCGAPLPQFNLALLKPPVAHPDAAVRRAEAYFAGCELPFRFGVRDDHRAAVEERLLSAGWVESQRVPAMLLRKLPAIPPAPAELTIERVRGGAALDAFRGVAERGFGFPQGMGAVAVSDRVAAHPDVQLFLGRVGGVPAATSLLQMSNRVAGIYFVACEETFRKRGFGEALTWASVAGGAAQGAEVASLQASELGAPVYARMGFEVLAHYHYYALPGAGVLS